MNTVYLNGQYLNDSDAKISVYDRGFLFGDGVYEVVPIYRGRLHYFAEHLARLRRSLAAIAIPFVVDDAALKTITETLLQKNNVQTAALYLQITRGGIVGKRDHAFATPTTPSVFAFVQAWSSGEQPVPDHGIAAITVADTRWQRCDIKAITLLANALARHQAVDAGVDEAIFIHHGLAIEGSSSNVFAVHNGVLLTAPESAHILSGITRHVVLKLARQHGWTVQLRALTRDELLAADEVWVSSSLREIKAVTRLDGRDIGRGAVGEYYRQMMQWFRADASEQ